ncbi:LysM peptidoglycan-binding domain-containing C40 family peptidase [Streptomyces sparsogenes]|uniref:C40 family peptidase n=1 Tax=Streptomyces sparsogenes TaxID=67365 RepID=UPI0033E25237
MGEDIRAARRRTEASPAARAKPTTGRRKAAATVGRAAVRTGAVAVLVVLAVLAGALLAVHGPGGRASAQSPSPSRQTTPAPPAEAKPPAAGPKQDEDGQPKQDRDRQPAKPTTVVLVPGDTLYGLALKHHTTVKTLQKLNELGGSTLIYAGDTLKLPGAVRKNGEKTAEKHTKSHPEKPAKKPAKKHPKKPAKKHSRQYPKKHPHAKGRAAQAIAFAHDQLGKPYVWGGTGPRGYDCSGLTLRAWQAAGVKLPRTTWSQRYAGKATTRAGLRPGDLVLAYGDGHVALYIGGGKVIHAPGRGRTVTVAPLPPPSRTTGYRHIAD